VRLPGSDTAPPLTPSGDQARRWAQQELSDPAYAAAHPTPFDRIARAVQDFFQSLFSGRAEGSWAVWLAVGAAVLMVALIVAAVIIWGRPRAHRRSRTAAGELFGDVEHRTAGQLRRAADAAAASGDWSEAIVLRFRATARDLAERELVETPPGTTVHGFARAASLLFPEHRADLDAAADSFDEVRYLGRPGTAQLYRPVAAADDGLRTARTPELAGSAR